MTSVSDERTSQDLADAQTRLNHSVMAALDLRAAIAGMGFLGIGSFLDKHRNAIALWGICSLPLPTDGGWEYFIGGPGGRNRKSGVYVSLQQYKGIVPVSRNTAN